MRCPAGTVSRHGHSVEPRPVSMVTALARKPSGEALTGRVVPPTQWRPARVSTATQGVGSVWADSRHSVGLWVACMYAVCGCW